MFQNQSFIHPPHKIGFLEQFTKFAAKYLCWSLFLIKLQFWGPATLLNKIPTQVLSREVYKFLKTVILKNICEMLLLNIISKDTRTQLLSCEFCELFKNIYFLEYLQTASSETPVRGSFFDKVTSLTTGLTAWRLLTVLESDCRTVIFL